MAIPTIAEAAAYVSLIETAWGIKPEVLDVGVDFAGCREVTTAENYWTVWYLPNGVIYGEC